MMKKTKTYSDASSFRRALEERLLQISKKDKVDLQRLRRQVAFDRLLARLFSKLPSPWVLKGGYAMQLRTPSARSTKDIDLAMKELRLSSKDSKVQNAAILEMIRDCASQNLSDFFEYIISDPTMDLDAAPYGGARFHVEARMEERTFEKFHLDVGVGDVWIEPLEKISSRNLLEFAGLKQSPVLAIPKEQQFAEKLHAYTLDRGDRQNSRVKDLVDMVLLVDNDELDKVLLKKAIEATFDRRATHAAPSSFPAPPTSWNVRFETLARECGINGDITSAYQNLEKFMRGVLA